MSRETKAGLLMILLLAGVFGAMVYKRMHQPAVAMAEQNAPAGQESADSGGPVQSSNPQTDPGTPEEPEFEKPPQRIIPAVASEPPNDFQPKSQNDSSTAATELDPFGEELPKSTPAKPRLPTNIPDEFGESSSPVANTGPQQPLATGNSEPVDSGTSPFDPFAADESQPSVPKKSPITASPASDPFDNDETTVQETPRRQEAPIAGSISAPIPVRSPVAAEVQSSQIEFSDEKDPFAGSPAEKDSFETPVRSTPDRLAAQPARRETETDPFGDSSADLKAPPSAGKSPAIPAFAQDDFPQQTPKGTRPPVELQQDLDDSFDQIPAKSNVPALSIPSRDAMPTAGDESNAGDERFGGFRPAGSGGPSARAFPDERPAIPAISNAGPGPRRVSRPAPVTQIDEDFAPRSASRPHVIGESYQVEPGDNYWTISRKKYGAGRYFMALAQHNALVIPDLKRMRPGVTIATPSIEALERTYPQLIPQAAAIDPIQTASATPASFSRPAEKAAEVESGFYVSGEGAPMYRVGSEDTLSGIAQRHLGRSSRWVQIFEMNRDTLTDGNSLKIGAALRLPADASRVEVVGGARTFR